MTTKQDTFFSLDFQMNESDDYDMIDNEEYVIVDFGDNKKDDNEAGQMDIDDDDDQSYDQCDDEELSLTPSISASVCSETMFGDLGFSVFGSSTSKVKNDSSASQGGNNGNGSGQRELAIVEESGGGLGGSNQDGNDKPDVEGKLRSCSIVSLHDEEDEIITPAITSYKKTKKDMTMTNMDIDTDVPSTTNQVVPSTTSSEKKDKATKKKAASTDANEMLTNASSSKSLSANTNSGGSRLSNKKRRKKIKEMKKAAAVAAFTVMKQEQSMQHIASTAKTPIIASIKTAKNSTSTKHASKKSSSQSNSIAVICATRSILDYKESLKNELNMKKKSQGTLNFES